MIRLTLSLAALALATTAACPHAMADPPPHPLASFSAAKRVARDVIFAGHAIDFYCGCAYTPVSASGGKIEANACGYEARKSAARGKKLEWEHIMPAFFFGHDRQCWTNPGSFSRCLRADGTKLPGRACCERVDEEFSRIESDLHNLVPAVGELNGDRSNLPYGVVDGEPRLYGACDFEIGGSPKVTEPPDTVRGDAARVWLYMSATYDIPLPAEMRSMFKDWSAADPVDAWEKLRDQRVKAAQGNSNPNVAP